MTAPLLKTLRLHATATRPYRLLYMAWIRRAVRRLLDAPPISVYIEPTNLCNSDCFTCARKAMTRPRGVMDMDLYRRVVDDCASMGVRYVVLQMFGEPLMDKGFLDKARYAKQRGLKTSIYTNGSLLDEEKIEPIVRDELLDHIVFSIDGATESEYGRNRPRLSLSRVEENLHLLLRRRRELGKGLPSVRVHCTQLPGVEYDIAAFNAKWEPVTDGISFTPTRDWAGQVPGISTLPKRDLRFPCFLLWYQFYVLWDGRVTFCSIDFDGKHTFGRVTDHNLRSLWSGRHMNELRELHLQEKMNDHLLCGQCIYSTHEKTWWWHDPVKLLF